MRCAFLIFFCFLAAWCGIAGGGEHVGSRGWDTPAYHTRYTCISISRCVWVYVDIAMKLFCLNWHWWLIFIHSPVRLSAKTGLSRYGDVSVEWLMCMDVALQKKFKKIKYPLKMACQPWLWPYQDNILGQHLFHGCFVKLQCRSKTYLIFKKKTMSGVLFKITWLNTIHLYLIYCPSYRSGHCVFYLYESCW